LESHSLFELNEYIKRVIALNFPQPIWINCEISQIKEVRGNVYIDLVEQDENEQIIAQASANIWYKNFLFIKNKLGVLTNNLLSPGSHIKIKVIVDFNERYGYKLNIEDIDPTYTLGRLEINRQKIIERVKAEGAWDLNRSIDAPLVIQRIAIISSDTAAGYKDFITQISENQFGYKVSFGLFTAAMQGQNTEADVCKALDQINSSTDVYDAIFIIRGGGSKIDLSYFDNFNIAMKIAQSPLPVFTGIGHEIDQSVADMVAHRSLKTPTACAAYIIDQMSTFESNLLYYQQQAITTTLKKIKSHESDLKSMETIIHRSPRDMVSVHKTQLTSLQKLAENAWKNTITRNSNAIQSIQQTISAADPKNILQKGFVLVKQEDKYITRAKNLDLQKIKDLEFYDETIKIN
jgi:exodeoxyribonuclease VII large subunit